MENTVSVEPTNTGGMDWKTILIIILTIIVLLFTSLGSFTNEFISGVLYSTGTILGDTSTIVKNTTETGLDIADGAIQNGSDLLIKASENTGYNVDRKVNLNDKVYLNNKDRNHNSEEPKPDNTTNPIQNPIASTKSNWCLVGEYQGKRGCIAISQADKCMSGQIFPTQYACLNPNFSQNVLPNMTTPLGIPPRVDLSALPNNNPSYDQQLYAEKQITNVPGNNGPVNNK
jgi:hypothetical protein